MNLRKIEPKDITGIEVGGVLHDTLGMVNITVSPTKKQVYLYADGNFYVHDIRDLIEHLAICKDVIDKKD